MEANHEVVMMRLMSHITQNIQRTSIFFHQVHFLN